MVVEGNYDAEYFMRRMPIWEAVEYLASIEYRGRDSWEQARLITHIVAQANSKNEVKPTSIRKFPWDSESEKLNQEISNSERERLQKKAEQLEKKYNE